MKFLSKILLCFLTIAGEMKYGEGKREKVEGLDKLNLHIEVPKYVKAGDTAVLKCIYTLGGDSLYTMKWYKGNQEFFRYTPKESPPIKTFPISGLQIDLSQSNSSQLTMKRVDFNMSARYSCEVTTDFPDFTTDVKTSYLFVVAYPERRPEIMLPKRHYAIGDLLEANCTSYRSKPAANLTWLINGNLANAGYQYPPFEQKFRDSDNKESSQIGIRFIVRQSHFLNARFKLACFAKILNLYYQTSEETVFEDDRPKISSVVDNSSSTGSGSNNKLKSTGSSQSNSASSPTGFFTFFFITTTFFATFYPFLLLNGGLEDWRGRQGATKFSSGLALPLLMR